MLKISKADYIFNLEYFLKVSMVDCTVGFSVLSNFTFLKSFATLVINSSAYEGVNTLTPEKSISINSFLSISFVRYADIAKYASLPAGREINISPNFLIQFSYYFFRITITITITILKSQNIL